MLRRVMAWAAAAAAAAGAVGMIAAPASAAATTPQIQSYVTQVYADLFDRVPDATGVDYWTGKLTSSGDYAAVANFITSSTEYRSRLITDSYEHYLGRAPDAAGLAFWLAQMAAGQQIEAMQAGFIASDEFYARGGGTDAGWVGVLYDSVLGRSPAPAEVSGWVAAIAAGMNRGAVALGFLYSTEHLTTVIDGYFVDLLARHLDPSGTTYWVTAVQRGSRDEQIIAGIVASAEYLARFGITPGVVTPPTAPPITLPPTSTPPNPGDTKNCSDFATQAQAQAWFDTYYPYYGDVARLDADNDRIACESLS